MTTIIIIINKYRERKKKKYLAIRVNTCNNLLQTNKTKHTHTHISNLTYMIYKYSIDDK